MEIYKQSTNSHVQKSETWIFNKQIRYDLGWSHLINPRDSYHVIILTYTGSITWDKPDKSVIIINITILAVVPYLDFLSCGSFIVWIKRFPRSTLKCYFDPFLYLGKPSFVIELYVSGRDFFLEIASDAMHLYGGHLWSSNIRTRRPLYQVVRIWSFLDSTRIKICWSLVFSFHGLPFLVFTYLNKTSIVSAVFPWSSGSCNFWKW